MPNKRYVTTTEVAPNNGAGYFPEDIKRAYNIPANLQGEGQTIGILEFSNGYSMKDAVQFWSSHNIPTPTVTFVSIDGTSNDDGVHSYDAEATLDLQWAGAIAPKADIVVYEISAGSTYQAFATAILKTFDYILHNTKHRPNVLSVSYGDAEKTFGAKFIQEWSDAITKLDASGITVVIASGDQGAYGMHESTGEKVVHADGPATATMAVAVGGTTLQLDGTESAWTYITQSDGGATGGGFSTVIAKPAYQDKIPAISGTFRGIPDVALNADPATGYEIVFQGIAMPVGGTSVACPVFAAIVALANEARAKSKMQPISGLTKWLYENYQLGFFYDITTGNNSYGGVTGYDAVKGWDAATGFGSIDASAFIKALCGEDFKQVSKQAPKSVIQKHSFSLEVGWDKPQYVFGEKGILQIKTFDNKKPMEAAYPNCPYVTLSNGETGPVPTYLPGGKQDIPWSPLKPGTIKANVVWDMPDGTKLRGETTSTWISGTPKPHANVSNGIFKRVLSFFERVFKICF